MIHLYGWSDALRQSFAPHAARELSPARVIVQQRGLVTVVAECGELAGRASGRLLHEAAPHELPVVGDWVAVTPRPAEGAATIHAVLPRRTAFERRAANTEFGRQVVSANIDVALLVAGLDHDFNVRRLERYLAAAHDSGAEAVIVLTKADLAADLRGARREAERAAVGVPVLTVSSLNGEGLDSLQPWLRPGATLALLGSSGAGKSSLVNALAGRPVMDVGEVREDDSRGRHTTTHRELVRLDQGTLILDSPGMRELGLAAAAEGVATTFEDLEALAGRCRFRDCAHGQEPGCAVRAALQSGELEEGRWRAFDKLRREAAHFARREDPLAREAERRRWIAINKSLRARTRPTGGHDG